MKRGRDVLDLSVPFISRDLVLQNGAPSVAESEVSADDPSIDTDPTPPRERLRWEFKGLTLWLEYEGDDLTKAIDDAVHFYGTERIPVAHSTAIYGMTHLSINQAKGRLHKTLLEIPVWPFLDPARGITQGIAQDGQPGQVCSIAWAEITFATNQAHEEALDKLYELFEMPAPRQGPWTPHISFVYDNPEESVVNMPDTFDYVAKHPTLMEGRRVKAMSLWDTNGKMGDWKCLDRVDFLHKEEKIL